MSSELFLVAIKSTIDKFGKELADGFTPPLPFVDLDDRVNTAGILSSDSDAILWEFLNLRPEEVTSTLNQILFNIGAKTTNDPSSYDILSLAGKVQSVFEIGKTLNIFDYSNVAPPTGTPLGLLIITDLRVDPQAFDRESGVRMVSANAKAVSYG